MKDLVIIGAGDFARETVWIAERMNAQKSNWNILGYVDDAPEKQGMIIDGYPVIGTLEWLENYNKDVFVTCSVGTGKVREKIWNRFAGKRNIYPATMIDPAAIIGKNCVIGEASIICAGTVMAIASKTGFNTIINLNSTIGHDAVLEDCVTVHPGCNISGKVIVGECSDIGTGTKVIQGKTIAPHTVIGAGAVVVTDITENGTYVGVPARKLGGGGKA